MLTSLKIQYKLAILCSAFLLPIAFLAYLFIAQTGKDVSFAAKELEGSAYFNTLRHELSAVVALSQGGATSSEVARAQADVQQFDAAKASEMNATEAAGKAADSVRAALQLPKTATAASYDAALGAVADHIAKVEDGSNLTLDPDLDSYYTQDLVTVKLPAVVLAASQVLTAALPMIHEAHPTPDMTVAFLSRKGELATLLASVDGDIASGERGNPDGTLKPALNQAYADFVGKFTAYAGLLDDITKPGAAKPSAESLRAAHLVVQRSAAALSDVSVKELNHLLDARIRALRTKELLSLALTAVVLLATMAFAWWVALSISNPLRALTTAMVRLSQGHPDIDVPALGDRGEIGEMASAVNIFKANADKIVAMLHAENVTREIGDIIAAAAAGDFTARVRLEDKTGFLRDIGEQVNKLLDSAGDAFQRILEQSTQVASSAGQCSQAVRKVAEDVNSQSSSLRHLAVAIGDTAKQITLVSSNAGDAGEKARSSAGLVKQGEVSLSELFEKMESIGNNSRRIRQITEVISQIANRTHILSLNAAIEAARAGEHGKGFVVVAQEVGKLAEGAAQQSHSISQIVEQAAEDAQSGLQSAAKVRGFMSQVSAEVASTDEKVRSIVEAMGKQQLAVVDIDTTVGDLEQVARSNVVTADEIATTMIELLGLAESTRNQVSQFKTA